jgi:hypothetical protein
LISNQRSTRSRYPNFGKNLKEARRRYRQFVEKGIKQGRRPELQGGGLVRSAGGDTSVLCSKDKENRELSDQRVLGSGGFVGAVLQKSERLLEKKYKPKQTIDDLIMVVAGKVGVPPELICFRSKQKNHPKQELFFPIWLLRKQGTPRSGRRILYL